MCIWRLGLCYGMILVSFVYPADFTHPSILDHKIKSENQIPPEFIPILCSTDILARKQYPGSISILNECNRLPVILSQNPSHLLSVRQGRGLIWGTYYILNLWFILTLYLLINKYDFILYAFIHALQMIAKVLILYYIIILVM